MIPQPERVSDLIPWMLDRFPHKEDVFRFKREGAWHTCSVGRYRDASDEVSRALLAMGIQKGDRVASIFNNRPEWNFLDMGLAQIGAVHVTIYPTLSVREMGYILSHSGARLLFLSYQAFPEDPGIFDLSPDRIIILDRPGPSDSWSVFLEKAQSQSGTLPDELMQRKQEVKPDDSLCLIYTSGTTGTPKGVLLSHRNLMSTAVCSARRHVLKNSEKCLSVLPLSHVFEHMVSYMHQLIGVSIVYGTSLQTFVQDVSETQAQGFVAVPRLIEKFYEGILAKGMNLKGLAKWIFFLSLRLGFRFEFRKARRPMYRAALWLADRLVFTRWRKALGGQIRFIGCGGASLQPRLERLFWAAGMPVYVGYGLTETSPVVSVNYGFPPDLKIGSVGKVLEICSVKIEGDGEILVKGPNLMLGYFEDPDLTSASIDQEGWFHSGDIGTLDGDGFLFITDRKKEIFKTSGGKYVAPQVVENRLKESLFIEEAMVIGEGRKYPAALVVPNFPFLHDWCTRHHLRFHDNADLVALPEVKARFSREIDKTNETLSQFERIKAFALVSENWTPATGELSPTLKLRRKVLDQKYDQEIQSLFQ